jgi:hypothetical protein
MTPERTEAVRFTQACVFDGILHAEERATAADPDADLAALVLGHVGIGVG